MTTIKRKLILILLLMVAVVMILQCFKKRKIIIESRNIIRLPSVESVITFLKAPFEVACRINEINPFDNGPMRFMFNHGELKCPQDESLKITVALSNISISVPTRSLRVRSITDDNGKGFRFSEFSDLKNLKGLPLKTNHSGTIRNLASKRCVVPAAYDHNKPPGEMEVMLTSNCGAPEADFSFTEDGLIKHKLTAKCLEPKGGSTNPPQDTIMVISDRCQIKFDVMEGLLLHMVNTTSCIHNHGGGNEPTEGQRLCVWPSCAANFARLTYEWFLSSEAIRKEEETSKNFALTTDMNHLQIGLKDGKIIDKYVLSVAPKPLPATNSSSRPNIIILCIEKASAAHFKRKLANTSKIMSIMGAIEYTAHAAVSPSSVTNVMAMLNGNASEGTTQNSIFSLAKKHNYVSMISGDDPAVVAGMEKHLVADHNTLPFFRAVNKHLPGQDFCVTGQPVYNMIFDYLSNFFNTYPSHAKLAVVLLSELCGPNFNFLGFMDKGMASLLSRIRSLKNTIVFIQTLKGLEDGKLRQFENNVDEMKRPLLSAVVSDDIKEKYMFEPTRSDQLSTPFDIYVTLHNLISQEELQHKNGKSLLQTSDPRNCLQTAIDPAMCPCR